MYRSSIGENEASINTLQMLTNIENRLEELFEKIEKMPPEKVEEAEKVINQLELKISIQCAPLFPLLF